MTEIKKIQFKDRLKDKTGSKYIIVPAKLLKLEGITDEDVLDITITVNQKND